AADVAGYRLPVGVANRGLAAGYGVAPRFDVLDVVARGVEVVRAGDGHALVARDVVREVGPDVQALIDAHADFLVGPDRVRDVLLHLVGFIDAHLFRPIVAGRDVQVFLGVDAEALLAGGVVRADQVVPSAARTRHALQRRARLGARQRLRRRLFRV